VHGVSSLAFPAKGVRSQPLTAGQCLWVVQNDQGRHLQQPRPPKTKKLLSVPLPLRGPRRMEIDTWPERRVQRRARPLQCEFQKSLPKEMPQPPGATTIVTKVATPKRLAIAPHAWLCGTGLCFRLAIDYLFQPLTSQLQLPIRCLLRLLRYRDFSKMSSPRCAVARLMFKAGKSIRTSSSAETSRPFSRQVSPTSEA
jgi:hypothetical protein